MSSRISRLMFQMGLIALFLALLAPNALAEKKKYTMAFDGAAAAATLATAAVDTSNTLACAKFDALSWTVAFEGDSCLVTVQGSWDEIHWTTLTSYQCNGTDGTFAIQWSQKYTVTSLAAKNDVDMPPPPYVRWILNNNDTAGSDDLGLVIVRAYGER